LLVCEAVVLSVKVDDTLLRCVVDLTPLTSAGCGMAARAKPGIGLGHARDS
jgi:hypothetical protein